MNELWWLAPVIGSAVIVAVIGAFGELASRLVRAVLTRAGARHSTTRAVRDGVRAVWVTGAAAAVVGYTGLASQYTVLTLGGIAGLVVSLSLQAVFGNIIAGVLLVRDGVVALGDVVEYSGVKGPVVRIALRNTWVQSEKGGLAVIGNSSLSGGPLINHSASARLSERYEL